ncbi:hypothetical protein DYB32_003488 [Aphanomyces invadans]|uniref:Uncharacterized protein n=1 Tax=Aphanomyces invadans TaxID=157072 RepID=A0A3R6ZSF1_9STRA|nr:hypothetical protein DYB32_003488 [Aphanomyces invadans]
MCFDSVKKHDLRSVLIDRHRTIPLIGSSATFHLIHRSRSSWFPHLPAAMGSSLVKGKIPSVHCSNAAYSRILESTPSYLQAMIEFEMHDLHTLAAEAQSSGDDHALPVVQEALAYCEKRLAKLFATTSSEGDGVAADASGIVSRSAATKAAIDASDDEPPYTFYQLHNGHTAILHPLCMRALTREFGHDNSFPYDITATVLEIEHVVMNDDVRKRFRYMAHLPSHCDLFLVEVDLAGIVSPDTMSHFQTEFKKRARARQLAKRHQKLDKKKTRSDSFEVSLMLQLALDNDTHYPQLQNVAVGAPPDKDGELERFDTPDESPYNSPYATFASVTTNQGYYPAFNVGGRDGTSMSTPGWPNVGSAMAVPFNLDELQKELGQNGKKAKGKGVSLFATSQRRSYR